MVVTTFNYVSPHIYMGETYCFCESCLSVCLSVCPSVRLSVTLFCPDDNSYMADASWLKLHIWKEHNVKRCHFWFLTRFHQCQGHCDQK